METEKLSPAEQLCLSCGMCCSGLLHNWTYLQHDEISQAISAGLEVIEPSRRQARRDARPVFRQPCRALDETTCQIYANRPQACQAYYCHVLQRLLSGELTLAEGQEITRKALQLIDDLREKMPQPMGFLSLDWQVRVNWPSQEALPEDVEPIFNELAAFLDGEWKMKWRRKRHSHQR